MGSCYGYCSTKDQFQVDEINGSVRIVIDGIVYTSDTIKTLYNEHGNICADGKTIIHTNSSPHFYISIDGDTKSVTTISGDININGQISGSVQTISGDVNTTSDIKGKVDTTSGDVFARVIDKEVSTVSGDVYRAWGNFRKN